MKLLKENGMLSEAWFIDGVRYGLGRSINEGLIAFKDEFFKYNSYLGKKQNEEGDQYEGYFKDDKQDGEGIYLYYNI